MTGGTRLRSRSMQAQQQLTPHERVVAYGVSALRETRLTRRRACALGLSSPSFAHAHTLADTRAGTDILGSHGLNGVDGPTFAGCTLRSWARLRMSQQLHQVRPSGNAFDFNGFTERAAGESGKASPP